jgi:hypothetical protein
VGAAPVLPVFGLNLPKLPSVERALEEQRFMAEGLAASPPKTRTWKDIQETVRSARRRFDRRDTFDNAPLEALRELGLTALRPDRLEDLPTWQPQPGSRSPIDELLRDLRGLRRSVWSAVESWQQAAMWASSLDGRRQARARLKAFLALLVPDSRGRQGNLGPPPAILELGYRQLLFRLNLARRLLDESASSERLSRASLADVASESGLPVEWIGDWLFFHDRMERKARPLTSEQMAMELAAGIAGIGADSFATMISRGRRERSRKTTDAR